MPRKKLTEEEEIARVKAMYEYEHNCRDNGYTVVAGVDEAGRGPLAGPVYAAAVIPVSYTHLTLPTICSV